MDKAAKYAKTNGQQRQYTMEIIEELKVNFNWKENIGDTLLDIGCGPGDVMIDFVLPLLGNNYGKIVGGDRSEAMVQYGKNVFTPKDPRIEFKVLDISKKDLIISEQFDHVTSFWCLNWVQDQRLAVKNMFDLLKPGGDILLEFAAKSPFCTTYVNLSNTTKWKKYLTDIHRFIYPQQYSNNPVSEFVSCLEKTGFHTINCSLKKLMFIYKNFQEFRDIFQPVNIFESNIPASLHDEFYLEYFEEIRKQPEVLTKGGIEEITKVPIYVLIAYATKPLNTL